jgi:hypothetical protein
MLSKINIRISVAIIILLGITAYTGYEFRNLALGPVIIIEAPENGTEVKTPVTNIRGRAKNITRISMNDRDISVDAQGEFEEKFVLSQGSNVIKHAGQDRFGRQKDVFIEVLYNDTTVNSVAVR